ncbi:hypothetical protein [Moritella sp. Urea-trap-13]|uniref:hypothetical protein n=1 Tax=Moritella sp. Urea-trap-13 TaxID=2058327 RepID=UPI0012FE95CA|nr:hypothetical protein [Moritella sp. Urea-trap-13]
MDFPAVALLSSLGINPLVVFTCWVGWQLVKVNKGIRGSIVDLNTRVTVLEKTEKS